MKVLTRSELRLSVLEAKDITGLTSSNIPPSLSTTDNDTSPSSSSLSEKLYCTITIQKRVTRPGTDDILTATATGAQPLSGGGSLTNLYQSQAGGGGGTPGTVTSSRAQKILGEDVLPHGVVLGISPDTTGFPASPHHRRNNNKMTRRQSFLHGEAGGFGGGSHGRLVSESSSLNSGGGGGASVKRLGSIKRREGGAIKGVVEETVFKTSSVGLARNTTSAFWSEMWQGEVDSVGFHGVIVQVFKKAGLLGRDVALGHINVPATSLICDGHNHEGWWSLIPPRENAGSSTISSSTESQSSKSPHVWAAWVEGQEDGKACSVCGKSTPSVKLGVLQTCRSCNLVCHAGCQAQCSANCGQIGNLRVSYSFVKQCILPLRYYGKLKDLIMDPNLSTLALLTKVVKDEREEIAHDLLKICDGMGKSAWLVSGLCAIEISKTTTPTTLFRGNSLATKLLDMYLKQIGMAWLKEVLTPTVVLIIKSDQSTEIDPMKMDEKDRTNTTLISERRKLIQEYADSILSNVKSCLNNFPRGLKAVFKIVYDQARLTFGCYEPYSVDSSNSSVPYIAVTSFLFLRFITAATLSPKLFHIVSDGDLSLRVQRTLTLVAKTLQTAANLASFSIAKEPWMEPINGKMPGFHDKVLNMVETLCDDVGRRGSHKKRRKSVTWKQKMHSFVSDITPAAGLSDEEVKEEMRCCGCFRFKFNKVKPNTTSATNASKKYSYSPDSKKSAILKTSNTAVAETSAQSLASVDSARSGPKEYPVPSQQVLTTTFVDDIHAENHDIETCMATMQRHFSNVLGRMKVNVGIIEGEEVDNSQGTVAEADATLSRERQCVLKLAEVLQELEDACRGAFGGGGAMGLREERRKHQVFVGGSNPDLGSDIESNFEEEEDAAT